MSEQTPDDRSTQCSAQIVQLDLILLSRVTVNCARKKTKKTCVCVCNSEILNIPNDDKSLMFSSKGKLYVSGMFNQFEIILLSINQPYFQCN